MLAQRIQPESACIPFFNIIKGEVGCAGSPQNPSVRYLKMAGSPYFGADPPGIPSGSPSAPGQIPSIPFVFFKCNDNIFTHHSLRQTHSFKRPEESDTHTYAVFFPGAVPEAVPGRFCAVPRGSVGFCSTETPASCAVPLPEVFPSIILKGEIRCYAVARPVDL